MANIFHPATNVAVRVAVLAVLLTVGLVLGGWDQFLRSFYVTGQNTVVEQPVAFSHKHHVGALGLDCRYCHYSVEESAFAGIPATKVCMTCHSQVWNDTDILAEIRTSYREDLPMKWNRVHDLPDYVYFDHSVHIAKGVGCTTCHGQVDDMPLMMKVQPLTMGWCLSCHRHPEENLRALDDVFSVDWSPDDVSDEERADFVKDRDITTLQNCSICHR